MRELVEEVRAWLAWAQESGLQNLAPQARRADPAKVETVTKLPVLEAVRTELGECTRCKLHKTRTNIVFGVGSPEARLMFVGEAPGEDEDLQGYPFVGKAGQLLTKMIEAMGLRRDDVYICNTVKCRPPNNRNPEPDELLACEPFLKGQLGAVQPEVIVTLGKFAAQALRRVPHRRDPRRAGEGRRSAGRPPRHAGRAALDHPRHRPGGAEREGADRLLGGSARRPRRVGRSVPHHGGPRRRDGALDQHRR